MAKIRLAVFDWAGTTVDYGCIAPYVTFQKTFAEKNIELTKEEILAPMGMEKKDHIRTLLQMERVAAQWEEKYNRPWTEADVEELYEMFEGSLADVVAEYSTPIPQVVETIKKLREEEIFIGSTTGYTGAMMEKVLPKAKENGYEPDYLVTPEMVGSGRPAPFMIYENMRKFGVYPAKSVVKVGDTVMDIREGVSAGVWTVGILEGSSQMGYSEEEMKNLTTEELNASKKKAVQEYLDAKADFVIETMAELPDVIDKINQMLAEKEAK